MRSDERLFSEMPETLRENDLHASDNGLSSIVGRYQLASWSHLGMASTLVLQAFHNLEKL